MTSYDSTPTRRRWLLHAGLAMAATPLCLMLAPARAGAAVKAAKGDVGYQYAPKGSQRCGLCASFIPGDSPQGAGSCKLVDGVIPQNGWCSLFTKR
jgi:hypothetical protein